MMNVEEDCSKLVEPGITFVGDKEKKEPNTINSQENDLQTSKQECFQGDHLEEGNKLHSNVDTDNIDSVLAPTTELSTSLSCSSVELCEQPPSNGDSGFDMASNANAENDSVQGGEKPDVCASTVIEGTEIDFMEGASAKTAKVAPRRNYRNRNYRNRDAVASTSEDEDEDAEVSKVKYLKTTATSTCELPTLVTETCEQVKLFISQNVETENRLSEIASTSITANCDIVAHESDLPTTPPSVNEDNNANGAAEKNFTPRANRGRRNRLHGRSYRNRMPYESSTSSCSDHGSPGEESAAPLSSSENTDNSHSESSDVSHSTSSFQGNFIRHAFSCSDTENYGNHADEDMSELEQNKSEEDVLDKPKPNYTWNSTFEIMRREHGLCGIRLHSLRNGFSYGFNSRFYSSRHVVERMKLSHPLRQHTGCVNSLNFSRSGDLLCTGSDDTKIIVWNWAQNRVMHNIESEHTANIFQTKFIEGVNCDGINIISTGRDREVRHITVPPSGGGVTSVSLYRHRAPVHKLVICPRSPQEIISAGEDGFIRHFDLRNPGEHSSPIKIVSHDNKADERRIRLFGISHHPFKPEIAVCGCDRYVRIYDKRKMDNAVYEMCPKQLLEISIPQITCCVYNCTGSEVLASYSDEHIYLFSNQAYKKGEYLHQYKGHYNNRTIKSVNFFGPNSEYVISGSDCGNIFYWDKNTEALLNAMPGDSSGVVNCLEPHPAVPILATSGLDHSVKIWLPSSESYPPDLSRITNRIKRNITRSLIRGDNTIENRQFNYFIRQLLGRARPRRPTPDNYPPDPLSSTSSSISSSEADYPPMDRANCNTQ